MNLRQEVSDFHKSLYMTDYQRTVSVMEQKVSNLLSAVRMLEFQSDQDSEKLSSVLEGLVKCGEQQAAHGKAQAMRITRLEQQVEKLNALYGPKPG